jgi:hypothetical protein
MFRAARALVALTLLLLGGCASSSDKMATTSEPAIAVTAPADQAVIVFVRPSVFGGAIQSVVYDVSGDTPALVGIVSAETKIAYAVPPGRHRFMVISEAADFMDAEVAGGKTYYTLVTARPGWWRARFSLLPVAPGNPELAGQLKSCSWVENTPASQQWAHDNMPSVQRREAEYLPKWLAKEDKPLLHVSDAQ